MYEGTTLGKAVDGGTVEDVVFVLQPVLIRDG